jgi:anaerobic C4-dicarboxylate transporter
MPRLFKSVILFLAWVVIIVIAAVMSSINTSGLAIPHIPMQVIIYFLLGIGLIALLLALYKTLVG